MNRIKFLFAATLTLVVLNGFVYGQDTTLTVTSAGRVGIGTTTPTYKLEIEGGATPLRITGGGSQFQKFLFDVATGGFAIFHMYDKDVNEDFRLATNGNSWLAGDGNVGIGTTIPGAKLEVAGQVKITGGTPGAGKVLTSDAAGLATWETATGGGDASYGSSGASPNNAVFVSDNGNVGIGTTSPIGSLHLSGVNPTIFIERSGSSDDMSLRFYEDGTQKFNFGLPTGVSERLDITDGTNVMMSFDRTTGNVGIGTTSPATKLDVNGAITLSPSGAAAGPSLVNSVDGVLVTGGATSGIRFNNQDNTLELMRITNAGNVGIGTTDPGVFRVKVVGPGGGVSALALQNEDGSGHLTLQNNGGTTRLSMRLFSSGTVAGIFGNNSDTWISSNTNGTIPTKAFVYLANATGNVGIGTMAPTHPLEMASGAHVTAGGVWTDASSRQYKENISNLTPEEAIAALERLNPVKFNYKIEKDEEYVGFIAEDVPDLVATKDRQSLSPMDIVAVLTKVVQQQQKKIAELEARLNASQ